MVGSVMVRRVGGWDPEEPRAVWDPTLEGEYVLTDVEVAMLVAIQSDGPLKARGMRERFGRSWRRTWLVLERRGFVFVSGAGTRDVCYGAVVTRAGR